MANAPLVPTAAMVRRIAHRGCAAQYPENTIRAAEQSSPHVDTIECDVRCCKTGEAVVIHDRTLNRIAGIDRAVADCSAEMLREITVGDTEATVPLLTELLAAVPHSTNLNIEIKEPAAITPTLAAIDNPDRILISSFRPAVLATVKKRAPELARAYLCGSPDEQTSVTTQLQTATQFDCVAIHPHQSTIEETDLLSRAQNRGLDVNTWTITTRQQARRLQTAGVDGLILDRWDII